MSATSELWPEVLTALENSVSEQQFETWFRPIELHSFSDEELALRVPNSFYREWLNERYLPAISDAVFTVTGNRPTIQVHVDSNLPSQEPAIPILQQTNSETNASAAPKSQNGSEIRLNREYVFENFIVGPCNNLPHAAALAVAESPSQAYNPLFIHGPVGMGKTHLVHAICNAMLQKKPHLNILYLSCEGFVNQFISSIERGDIQKFRYRYRHVDVLLVDDIHALQGKERTQEEFFHTFNTLHNDHKQIVLSSDSPPSEIPKLEERLVSRFNWGLVTHLDPPSFETRVAIVKKKAKLRGRHFPDEVVDFVADTVTKNIRELEGAVVTIIGYSSLANKPISLLLARDALRSQIKTSYRKPKMDSILDAVISEFRVRLADLQSKKRSKALVYPRQICMYLARNLTDLSLSEIGGYFGGRDHTTVLHAYDKISRVIKANPECAAQITDIERSIKNGTF